ncbi:MAG: aminopeptidase N [bacterium]|nr:aminopeptidase N [bacterium]
MSADESEQRGRGEKPTTVYRHDYRPPDYWVDRVDLDFELGEESTRVRATLAVRRNEILSGDPPPLVLNGEELTLHRVAIDGRELAAHEYSVEGEQLRVPDVPARFRFETEVTINPKANTALSGLYCSGDMFCTQCEAMGFRRITWFPDRPDIMSRYSTTITADPTRYPVLLSNGNLTHDEELEDGRRRVRWEDPYPKPCYLFALVAGDLRCHAGSFTTCSGRDVQLEIWVEPENIDRCEHALVSLRKAMKWDEEVYGREYDLDIYMVVAVADFNMGAMENKGLNIFNTKYVLARPETATDDDCEGIEGVIGHEYFHNWTGNRVTCRDWFQLTLKEGLTVFRDQQFSADMTSKAVKRIDDVKILRAAQFAEDAGPMKHPIRPDSYISMDNFYTSTVYNKGAEVIRMLDTLLGSEGFRRGTDLYFERHDGQAVTCDDFVSALADANGEDLDAFKRWYEQPGTPEIEARGSWDEAAARYTLELRQHNRDAVSDEGQAPPLHIPVRIGLLAPDGSDLALQVEGGTARQRADGCVLELSERDQRFVFEGVSQRPVPSILRDFSAPVRLRMSRSREELAFLMAHDSDAFSRWDAGQELATQLLLEMTDDVAAGRTLSLAPLFVEAFGRILADERLDHSLRSLALTLPGERVLGQEMEVIDVDALHQARDFAIRTLAAAHREALLGLYRELAAPRPYRSDAGAIADRRIKNTALAYLASLEEDESVALILAQYETATNMTDSQAALALLVDVGGDACASALASFYARWKDDALVLDKWFSVQAVSRREDALDRVLSLSEHPDFSLKNPNRMRSLVGVFCSTNQVRFHEAQGRGYRFLADTVLELNGLNPQIAARMVSQFNQWRRFDAGRRERMREELERIAADASLSKDVFEIVSRSLSEDSASPA